MHRNSLLLFDKYARRAFYPGVRVLEVGPRTPSDFQVAVNDPAVQWDTVDIYPYPGNTLTYVATSEYAFPIPDATYDIVFSAQVIEHVRQIWRWLPELARVTKPGGLVITINPANWIYHEAPVDCWRIFPEGMKALCEDAGLTVDLSVFEALDGPYKASTIAKQTYHSAKQWAKGALGLKRPIIDKHYPEAAVDTITIARRNGRHA